MQETAVVIGVSASRGLGAAIARKFAAEGLHCVVAGRTAERLAEVSDEIQGAGGACSPCVTDATDARALSDLMTFAQGLGPVRAVIFNVGNNQPIAFDELTAEQFEQFWRVCTLSAFLTAKAALPHLLDQGGSLLFTGASASMRGRPGFAHFGAAKSALRNLAQALAKDYGPRGIHVGHVVVDGVINGERIRQHFSEYLDALGEDGALEPDAIAAAYWQLHGQPRNAWTFELDVRPYKETW
jgi:NAD(P)-dependent dehydrogenase (short-subunit alcohol dehydrogenase family)